MDFRIIGIIFILFGGGLLIHNINQEQPDQMRVYVCIAMIGYGLYRTYQGFQQKN
ncbi:MAG: hypothetical protein ACI9N1_000013 [Flavobacteriales bacterium]|jgi:hypothetical protein